MSKCRGVSGDAVVCRTCLSIGEETRPLHAALRVAGTIVRPSDILKSFYKYQVDKGDGLPQDICLACVNQLTATYSFDTIIRDSWSKLSKTDVLAESYDDPINNHVDFDSDNDVKPPIELKESVVYSNSVPVRRKVHTKSECVTKLYCVQCKECFKTGGLLLEHCYTQHPARKTVGRSCDYCNEKFNGFQALIRHRMFHLSLHVCEICWQGFDDINDLNVHQCQKSAPEQVTDEAKRVLQQCDQCGKYYPPGYIKIHVRIHSNHRPYRCKYCPKRFKVPCSLSSHVIWNHKKTRTHKCDLCEAMFVTASARSAHKRKHHLKEKKHTCDTCSKKFFSKSEIQRHMLTHTGVKNFHCNICDKSYQTRYGLNVHLKSHSHAGTY